MDWIFIRKISAKAFDLLIRCKHSDICLTQFFLFVSFALYTCFMYKYEHKKYAGREYVRNTNIWLKMCFQFIGVL